MKKVYLFACVMPWLILAGGLVIREPFQVMSVPLAMAGMLWLAVSPAYLALAILIAYREGQYSKTPACAKGN